MSLFKRHVGRRHIGRRVAGVGVGVALMVLGLEAPAMADTAVTAVAPTSGPTNCVVDITGTGFRTFPDSVNTLTFVGPVSGSSDDVDAADWFSISDTEIWAVVPSVADLMTAGTTYKVVLTQPSGTNTAGGTFLFTGDTAAGGCAPTIASFTPTCGSAGDVVTITGTNLLDATNLDSANSGGDVFFRNTAATETEAAQPVPDLSSPTSLSAIVPTGVADGPIHVLTDVDTNPSTVAVDGVFSATSFLTPPPDCVPPAPTEHARSVTLSLRKHLVARGKVSVGDAFTDCAASVPVKIQRRVSGHWRTVGSTTTSDTGAYKKRIRDRAGKYRAKATQVSLGTPVTDICSGATSPVRRVS